MVSYAIQFSRYRRFRFFARIADDQFPSLSEVAFPVNPRFARLRLPAGLALLGHFLYLGALQAVPCGFALRRLRLTGDRSGV